MAVTPPAYRRPVRDPADRFFEKVAFAEERHKGTRCLRWTASLDQQGYGQFRLGDTMVKAHRWLYERWIGPIPSHLQPDHLCRHRWCVNPYHLELVTSAENTLRGEGPSAIHARKTHCIRGHEFDEDNTYTTPSGGRQCRACRTLRRSGVLTKKGNP